MHNSIIEGAVSSLSAYHLHTSLGIQEIRLLCRVAYQEAVVKDWKIFTASILYALQLKAIIIHVEDKLY